MISTYPQVPIIIPIPSTAFKVPSDSKVQKLIESRKRLQLHLFLAKDCSLVSKRKVRLQSCHVLAKEHRSLSDFSKIGRLLHDLM